MVNDNGDCKCLLRQFGKLMKFDKEDLWGFLNLKMNFYKDLPW